MGVRQCVTSRNVSAVRVSQGADRIKWSSSFFGETRTTSSSSRFQFFGARACGDGQTHDGCSCGRVFRREGVLRILTKLATPVALLVVLVLRDMSMEWGLVSARETRTARALATGLWCALRLETRTGRRLGAATMGPKSRVATVVPTASGWPIENAAAVCNTE